MTAALRFVFRIKTELKKSVLVLGGNQKNVAAPTSIPATGTSARNVFLPAEGQAAIAAIASLDQDAGFVDEQLRDFLHADELANAAAIAKFNHASDLRK